MKAEYNRFIHILSVDTDENGEENIEITVRGFLSKTKEGAFQVTYEECYGEGLTGIGILTVLSENEVNLIRSGSIVSELTVEKNKRHNCCYSTPMGDLTIGIYATLVHVELSESGGTVELNYRVDANGTPVGIKHLTMRISDII